MPEQLSLAFKQEDEAWDLVEKFIDELTHTGIDHHVLNYDQTKKPYLALKALPQFKEAERRRWQRFWDHCKRCADEVATWPAWKRGGASTRVGIK